MQCKTFNAEWYFQNIQNNSKEANAMMQYAEQDFLQCPDFDTVCGGQSRYIWCTFACFMLKCKCFCWNNNTNTATSTHKPNTGSIKVTFSGLNLGWSQHARTCSLLLRHGGLKNLSETNVYPWKLRVGRWNVLLGWPVFIVLGSVIADAADEFSCRV